MSIIQGQVQQALQPTRATGTPNAIQLQLGELGISEVLPRYGAAAWSGLVFYGGNTASQALSVASGTFTGLAIANPAGSGKNLIIITVAAAISAVGAVAVSVPKLGWAPTVAVTVGNSAGPFCSLLGSNATSSVAKVGASATLAAAPTQIRPLLGTQWITGGAGMWNLYVKDEVAGEIVVPPGQTLTIDAFVAAMSIIGAVSWMEVQAP